LDLRLKRRTEDGRRCPGESLNVQKSLRQFMLKNAVKRIVCSGSRIASSVAKTHYRYLSHQPNFTSSEPLSIKPSIRSNLTIHAQMRSMAVTAC
jgi:hypothetical protein